MIDKTNPYDKEVEAYNKQLEGKDSEEEAKQKMDEAKKLADSFAEDDNSEEAIKAREDYNAKSNSYNEIKDISDKKEAAQKKRDKFRAENRGIFGRISDAYNSEFGPDSKDSNFFGGLASKANAWAEKTHIPILSTRLQKATKTMENFLNIDSETATRRLNDSFAGIAGDNGAGQLYKLWFNPNTRKELFESVPEAKAKDQDIQQGLLIAARDRHANKEAEKKMKEEEMKTLARYFAEQNNDPKYQQALEDRRKAEIAGDTKTVKEKEKEIAKMNIENGYNKQAREMMEKGNPASDPGVKALKDRIRGEAYADQAAKERKERAVAAQYSDKPLKTQRDNDEMSAEAKKIGDEIKKAMENSKGIKTTLDPSVIDALAELFVRGGDSIAKSMENAIQNALRELKYKGEK